MLELRIIDAETVEHLGGHDPHKAYQDVCDVVNLLRRGEAHMPAEHHLDFQTGRVYALPARVAGRFDAVGLKWTAHRPTKPDDLPAALALTLINDAQLGVPRGLVASAGLTAARTAAVTALALRYAAPRTVKRVLLLGGGVQAAAHVRMLGALFPDIESLGVWTRRVSMPSFEPTPFPVVCEPDLAAASTKPYDAILCCTSAEHPLVGVEAVRAGRIIIQVGYHEVTFPAIQASRHVLVDAWGEFCHTSAKSLFQLFRSGGFSPQQLAGDLTSLLIDGWRATAEDSVYFSSFGLNVFDIALAARVLADAQQANKGLLAPMLEGENHAYPSQ